MRPAVRKRGVRSTEQEEKEAAGADGSNSWWAGGCWQWGRGKLGGWVRVGGRYERVLSTDWGREERRSDGCYVRVLSTALGVEALRFGAGSPPSPNSRSLKVGSAAGGGRGVVSALNWRASVFSQACMHRRRQPVPEPTAGSSAMLEAAAASSTLNLPYWPRQRGPGGTQAYGGTCRIGNVRGGAGGQRERGSITYSSPACRCHSYPLPTWVVEAEYGTVVTPPPPSALSRAATTRPIGSSPGSRNPPLNPARVGTLWSHK
mmetsp:Transcript_8865/g.28533  ORF Transcript_8865/g.28533 Transcript_8865/m.28533 type:complete len:261 (+) Transcript_8865:34-816(+)